jgi:translation initiation factor 2A
VRRTTNRARSHRCIPTLTIAARTPTAVESILDPLNEGGEASTVATVEALVVEYARDARKYLVACDKLLRVFSSSNELMVEVACAGIRAASFSPNGRYIVTFQRPHKNEEGIFVPNLVVWRVEDGASVLSLNQKELDKDHWPSIQFTADESHCVSQVTNTLHVHDLNDCESGPCLKFPVKGVSKFSLCPTATMGGKMLVMAYVPEIKGTPGFLALHQMSVCPQGTTPTPLARKSFFRANSVRFLWNVTGSSVLIIAAADVDATNQSYYGEQKLFFFSADGSQDMAVPMPKEGPIHDVQWSPKGDFFITVAGFMPAKSTLFNASCVPKFDLGSGPYSLVRWNPFGRFFALAGFGNLPGDVTFYDKKADAKCKVMGTTRASNGVSLEWSPCGRYVLTATTAPRLRVDNGFQVFKYNGDLLAQKRYDVLYEAIWRPVEEGTFEDRPQTPRGQGAKEPSGPAALAQPARSAGYVPPHLRRQGITSAPKASFSLARDQEDIGGKIKQTFAAARAARASSVPGAVPGNEPVPGASKAASKNAKRRAKKKQAENSST